jgi:hypothetical protein
LQLTQEQRSKLDELQKSVDEQIAKVLSEEQQKHLKEPRPRGPIPPGELIPPPLRDELQTSAEQKNQLDELQKSTSEKFRALLTDDQRRQFQEMRDAFGRGPQFAFGGPPPDGFDGPRGRGRGPDGRGGPGGRGGPDRRGGPGGRGRGGPGFGGPGGGSSLFRSVRYAPDYPGLAGKELKPGKKLEDVAIEAAPMNPPMPQPAPAPTATATDEKKQ